VIITVVNAGGAAEKAGLKTGDLLLQVGDKKIKVFGDLTASLKGLKAGEKLKIKVKRGDKELDIEVTLLEPLWSEDEDGFQDEDR